MRKGASRVSREAKGMENEEEGMVDLTKLASRPTTRRGFLKLSGAAGIGLASMGALASVARAAGMNAPAVLIMANAKGMILADPTRCTGCRRCELACTEFNDNKSSATTARVHVWRNYNFGTEGARLGLFRGEGIWGNFRLVQETCKQCPHPVPCATACPQGAIAADPTTGARVVDTSKCIGCGLCQGACPWEMIQVDTQAQKATKCFLCGQCVEACPTAALKFVPWQDHTKDTPPRQSAIKITAQDATANCAPCHVKQ